jgi:H+/Cl- antiporter ClcA
MIGFAIITAAQTLHDLKINYAQTFMPDYSKGYGVHVGISLIYIVAAFIPVAYKPIVGGSGIDYAKAMLNGITVPESASLTTLVCKAVGVVFTSAASLPVGIEGPMIHCGLCLGANVWRIIPRSVPMFDTLFSDRSRRDFAAIGTAAGVAAAFMSPIGGILFAMEEGASFWSIQLMWKCVNAATTTMCMWYFLSAAKTGYGFQSIPLKFAPVDDGEVGRVEVKLWEYFLIAAIGMMGGIIGAMFVDFNIRLAKLRRRMALSKPLKLLEVMFFTVLSECH